jgi:hypothetical protein
MSRILFWVTVNSLSVQVFMKMKVFCPLQTSNTEERGTHLQEPGTDKTMQQNLAIVTHLLKNSVTK